MENYTLGRILVFDVEITSMAQNLFPSNPLFDFFFSFFSLQGSSVLVWLIIVCLIVFLEEKKSPGISKKDRQFLLVFFITLLSSFFLCEVVMKNIFKRPRPKPRKTNQNFIFLMEKTKLPKIFFNDYSFPSSHATIAFSLASILSFFDKKRKTLYFLLALGIGYSRVYLGVHYVLDVVAGAVYGLAISFFIKKLFVHG
ncbi:MAG: phosphatase PAP2 family protein [Patescibacteria group bacterium]|nr:phosphatase PAP2 family protein [Patescibacteria group bacterium]